MKYYHLVILCLLFFSCSNDKSGSSLFELKNNAQVGINFENKLEETNDFNVYKYRNFYNGGGVALGDVNNDGLVDVYMVSNQKENKLYLNKGNWQFDDITAKAGVAGLKAWSTGVTMVDINADGFMDIYVCNSGDIKGDNKENELFINNGDLTFTESAAAYGLNDPGFSTHASFFDYDKDGDLDVYILNNSFQAIGSFNLRKNERPKRDSLGGDKLMQNQGGKFVDVSEAAGIYGSVIGFGLGITVGDSNNDGWEDIFISNDFFERDYLYINQKDGTFKEDLVNQMLSISGASMGADIADINNDGNNDIFVTEMLPSDYSRLKTVTTFEDWDRYNYGVTNGYYNQYTRNCLHLNNGDSTYSEISRFAGVEASDWSWGALLFDMDNDGNKDLFIANGIYRDLTNQDYLQYIANESVMTAAITKEGVNYKELIDIIPSNPIPNQAYHNLGNTTFAPYEQSGLQTTGFSNGSAYGDLDNDGDLDLIVNNVNMPCFVYENKANENPTNHFIKLELIGKDQNTMAIGAKIDVHSGDQHWYYENQPTRGFESSMDRRLNIGVGQHDKVDINILWSSGLVTNMSDVTTNQSLVVNEKDAKKATAPNAIAKNTKFVLLPNQFSFAHKENNYVDFNREKLNYHMMSTRGPCVSMGDLDGDQLLDMVIPGPKGQPSSVYLQSNVMFPFVQHMSPDFEAKKEAEQVKCDLFDADGDGDLDMYLASGGVELTEFSDLLYDELLFNDGKGGFVPSGQKLPIDQVKISTGAVAHADIDQDGDIDIFVGERVKIGQYGAPCSGYILANDGKGNYTDITSKACAALKDLGMITDGIFADMNGDGQADLIVVGEFMEVQVFENKKGVFTKSKMIEVTSGWWNVVKTVDIDNDGDLDLVLGNHGTNSRLRASSAHPLRMYFNDFDANGFPEGIITENHSDGKDYPTALRHNLMGRLPGLKKKYPDFESFKSATIDQIFTPEQLKSSIVREVVEMKSIVLVNDGNMKFSKRDLPYTVQYSPVYAIQPYDVNGDGFMDLIVGGNLYGVQPEMGRYDASYGQVLINDGKGNFVDKAKELGFSVKGEIRDFAVDGDKLYVFRNNDAVLSYQILK